MRTTQQLELTELENILEESVDSEPAPVIVNGIKDMEEFKRIQMGGKEDSRNATVYNPTVNNIDPTYGVRWKDAGK